MNNMYTCKITDMHKQIREMNDTNQTKQHRNTFLIAHLCVARSVWHLGALRLLGTLATGRQLTENLHRAQINCGI